MSVASEWARVSMTTRAVGARGWRASAHLTRAMDRAPASILAALLALACTAALGVLFLLVEP